MSNRGMNQLDTCLQKVIRGQVDGDLKIEVADKILELLEQEKTSLGTREKTLFVEAVKALSTSIDPSHQCDEIGLRHCLMTLRKAMTAEHDPYDSFTKEDAERTDVSYDMLVTTVKMIKGQIYRTW